jgi:peptidoglycan/xylan/chitin deacetylase (PgdA/CDA1 family)
VNFICLAYHRVATDSPAVGDQLAIGPACFHAQLSWLARHGYKGVTMNEAVTGDRSRRLVALTFDDGTRDFLTTCWPLLKEYGFGATLFVSIGLVGASSHLTWPEIRELSSAGVEIGGHGVRHEALDEMPARNADEELQETAIVLKSQLGLRRLGFAYPYGRCSPQVIELARKAGFGWAVTTRGGLNHAGTPRYQLRRTLIFRSDCGNRGRFLWPLKVWTGYAQFVEWRMDLRGIQ